MPPITRLLRRIPLSWRIEIKLGLRTLRDRLSGLAFRLASDTTTETQGWRVQTSVTQELKATAYSENKRHNLGLAIALIEPVVVAPGEVFSFWHLVGEPGVNQGFQEGRALVNDKLQPVVGGGLCQLSGLVYMLALQAGLNILERHAHSQDIYTDETRFTPLGSDATVVYGYKDLRFENNLDVAVQFRFVMERSHITAAVWAPENLACYDVDYRVSGNGDVKNVMTVRRLRVCVLVNGADEDRVEEVIAETVYR
jgi:vancomycin resistance protein VanW